MNLRCGAVTSHIEVSRISQQFSNSMSVLCAALKIAFSSPFAIILDVCAVNSCNDRLFSQPDRSSRQLRIYSNLRVIHLISAGLSQNPNHQKLSDSSQKPCNLCQNSSTTECCKEILAWRSITPQHLIIYTPFGMTFCCYFYT